MPRSSGQARRLNASKSRWRPIALVGVAVASGALVMLMVVQVFRARADAGDRRELASRIEAAEQSEKDGHAGQALVEFDEILAQARAQESIPADVVESVRTRRDALALSQAEARLRVAEADPSPTRGLGECLTLLHASDDDKALEPLRPRLRAHAAIRAEAELAEARKAFDDGKVDKALDLAARIVGVSPVFPSPDGPRLRDDARALAGSILSARGVLMVPVAGRFRLGKAEDYTNEIRPVLGEALRGRGYQLKPNGSSSFLSLWDTSSPFRISLQILDEAKLAHFAGTPHIGTRIDAKLSLWKAETEVWSVPLSARTRDLPVGMSAPEFNRLSLAGAPSKDVEHKFYLDARLALHDAITRKLGTLPEFSSATP